MVIGGCYIDVAGLDLFTVDRMARWQWTGTVKNAGQDAHSGRGNVNDDQDRRCQVFRQIANEAGEGFDSSRGGSGDDDVAVWQRSVSNLLADATRLNGQI